MTVLVTGASGHIGGVLVRAMNAQQRRPRVLVRNDTDAIEGLDVERVNGDVLAPDTLETAMRGVDVVYHLAARISIDGDRDGKVFETNALGTRNVVEACLKSGVKRLIHFSSIHALEAAPLDSDLDESRPFADGPGAPAYDKSKAAGEREVLEGVSKGLDAVILNPTGVIGPYDFKISQMGQVFLDLAHRRLIALVNGGFDWVDVRDVAETALRAEHLGKSGERYLLSGHWASIRELAEAAQEATGIPAPRMTSPLWLARMAAPFAMQYSRMLGKNPKLTPDSVSILRCGKNIRCDKAKCNLGHSARPLRETVHDIYAWFRSAGKI